MLPCLLLAIMHCLVAPPWPLPAPLPAAAPTLNPQTVSHSPGPLHSLFPPHFSLLSHCLCPILFEKSNYDVFCECSRQPLLGTLINVVNQCLLNTSASIGARRGNAAAAVRCMPAAPQANSSTSGRHHTTRLDRNRSKHGNPVSDLTCLYGCRLR